MTNDRRVALITGGAQRVGRAIALRLAESHFDIAFTYHTSQSQTDSLISELKSRGAIALAKQIDFAAADAAQQLADWVRSSVPRLDVLVNNASIFVADDAPTGPSHEQLMKVLHVNTAVPIELCTQLGEMLRTNRGHIVNMVDLLAERPWPNRSAYSASKAALASATLAFARKLAPEVTVNGIAPGVVAWPDDYPENEREQYLKRVPLNRAGTPDDVAKLVNFLVTEGSYITGQIIRLDGGRSIT